MGLEPKCVCRALHSPAGSDGTSSVDADETARKLCRQEPSATSGFLQTSNVLREKRRIKIQL